MTDNDTDWTETLWLAARNDPSAMERLDDLVRSDPSLCSRRLREFILSSDYADEMGTCDLLNVLAKVDGVDTVESWIVAEWPTCSSAAKSKICNWAYVANGMSCDLALALFNHSSTSVGERHLLAAGLATTATERSAESLVLGLLPRIGAYDDPARQCVLDSFIDSARRSFTAIETDD